MTHADPAPVLPSATDAPAYTRPPSDDLPDWLGVTTAQLPKLLARFEVPETPFLVRSLRLDHDVVIIDIAGELDIGSAPLLDEARHTIVAGLDTVPGAHVRVELAELTFCDTAGLDALSAAVAALEAVGAQVAVSGAGRQVRWLLAFAADHCWLSSGPLAAAAYS